MQPLYLVTKSHYYYPEGGTGDWLHVFTSESRARHYYEEEPVTSGCGLVNSTKYLIRVNIHGWTVLESTE